MRILFFILGLIPVASWADTFKLDDTHASIVFKVNHLGFSDVYGMFGAAEGTIAWDEANPSKSSIEVTVKTDSLTTLNKKRDDHLKGPDFFNVKQFPSIVLKSKTIKKAGPKKFDVAADLTLNGVTKPVKFVLTQNNTGKDPWGNMRSGADTAFSINRTDFGMNYMSKPGEIGNKVDLMISVEGLKQ